MALGAASLSLVLLYPLMKRVTYWPQLFLGTLRPPPPWPQQAALLRPPPALILALPLSFRAGLQLGGSAWLVGRGGLL